MQISLPKKTDPRQRNLQRERQRRGVAFEQLARRSFARLSPHPRLLQKQISGGQGTPFDYLVILPGLHHGVECKRVKRGRRLAYSALTPAERQGLTAWDGPHTPSSLLIWLDEPGQAWVVRWRDVAAPIMEGRRGSIDVCGAGRQIPAEGQRMDLSVYNDRDYWRNP
jgi:hypothetical protein